MEGKANMRTHMRTIPEARADLAALRRHEQVSCRKSLALLRCNPHAGRPLRDGSGMRKLYVVPGQDPGSLIGRRPVRDANGFSDATQRIVFEAFSAPRTGEVLLVVWAVGLAHPQPGEPSVYELASRRRAAMIPTTTTRKDIRRTSRRTSG